MAGSRSTAPAAGGRRSWQRDRVVATLRQRIADGTYAAGRRLPAHRELIRELAVGPATFQLAMDRLTAFGFVTTRGARGTFVPLEPAAHRRIALMMPNGMDHEQGGNRFVSGLLRSAQAVRAADGASRFITYRSGGTVREPGDGRRLLADARAGLLGGVAFVFTPWYLKWQDLMELAGLPLPRVIITAQEVADRGEYRASLIDIDFTTVVERLLHGFAAAGRRRLGAFAVHADQADRLAQAARRAGLAMRPEWTHTLPLHQPTAVCARGVARLLGSKKPALRPDCLLILDDNLVPHVTDGLVEAGLRDDDLLLAAHANPPDITRSSFPCQRYGIDAGITIARTVQEIDRLAAGGARRHVILPATAC